MRSVRHNGFTLLETLVVIVIMALIAAVMAPNLVSTANTRLRAAASELVAALRDTRLHALSHREQAVLRVELDPPGYLLPGSKTPRTLDRELNLQLTSAASDIIDRNSGTVRFYPDGSSNGGRISVSNGKLVQHIDVEWLTGRIQVREQ